jgi:hypothetical protein
VGCRYSRWSTTCAGVNRGRCIGMRNEMLSSIVRSLTCFPVHLSRVFIGIEGDKHTWADARFILGSVGLLVSHVYRPVKG